jgi:integrative and conjugative element protein (TIGR02256 family)
MIEIKTKELVLKIPIELLKSLITYIQDDKVKPESGGILIGYYIKENIYSITNVSFPNNEDKSSRFGFIRSMKNAQKTIDNYFHESKGKKIYLGEWHTHPEESPTPSLIDICSMIKQYTFNSLNSKVIFMIIVGIKRIYIAKVDKKGVKMIDNLLIESINLNQE